MRWLTTLCTVTALGVLTAILWNTEGRTILEDLALAPKQEIKSERLDIDTLVKLSDPALMDELTAAADESQTGELATATSSHGHAFIGSADVSDDEVAAAMQVLEERMFDGNSALPKPRFAGRTASGYGTSTGMYRGSGSANSNVNDYKYIPRMQRFGLTRTNRFGRVSNFGKRSLWDRSRFGQQQREMDRLRAKYEQQVGGRTVVRD